MLKYGQSHMWRYAVRRRAYWPGALSEELVISPGEPLARHAVWLADEWSPVGTLAAEAIGGRLRFPDSSPEVQQAIRKSRELIEVVHRGVVSMETVRRTVRESRWETPEMHGEKKRWQITMQTRWLPLSLAVYLSTYFGLDAKRLWFCERCRKPFVRSLKQPRQRRCEQCRGRPRPIRPYVKDLSPPLRLAMRRLQWRLDQQVHCKKRSAEDRRRILTEATADLREVERGLLTLAAWRKKWDEGTRRGPQGRRPGRALLRLVESPRTAPARRTGEPDTQREVKR